MPSALIWLSVQSEASCISLCTGLPGTDGRCSIAASGEKVRHSEERLWESYDIVKRRGDRVLQWGQVLCSPCPDSPPCSSLLLTFAQFYHELGLSSQWWAVVGSETLGDVSALPFLISDSPPPPSTLPHPRLFFGRHPRDEFVVVFRDRLPESFKNPWPLSLLSTFWFLFLTNWVFIKS